MNTRKIICLIIMVFLCFPLINCGNEKLIGEWHGRNCSASTKVFSLDSIIIGLSDNQVWILSCAKETRENSNIFELYLIKPADLGRGGMTLDWANFSKEKPIGTLELIPDKRMITKWFGFYNTKSEEIVDGYNFDWCEDTLVKSK